MINNLWQQRKAPIIDGIIFPDDSIVLLNIPDNPRPHTDITPAAKSTLAAFFNTHDKDYVSDINDTVVVQSADRQYNIICGDGSHGSDGFIALEERKTKALQWLFFSQSTNPFVSIVLEAPYIICENNNGWKYRLELDNPCNIVFLSK